MARKTKKTQTPKSDAVRPDVEDTEKTDASVPEAAVEDAVVVSEDPAPADETPPDAPPTPEAETAPDAEDAPKEDSPEDDAADGQIEPTPDADATDAPGTDVVTADANDPVETPAEPGADAAEDTVSGTTPDDMGDAPKVVDGEATDTSSESDRTSSVPPVGAALAPQPQIIEKRGPGFVPLVFGGLIAAAIGYAIPTYIAPPPGPDMSRVDALEARVDGLPTEAASVDLSGIEAAQADLSGRLDALVTRVDALEAAPAPAPTPAPATDDTETASAPAPAAPAPAVDPAAVDSLIADVAALSDRIDALPVPDETLGDRVAAVEAALADLQIEAQTVETTAEDLARQTARNQLRLAIDSGLAFAEPLGVLGGDVPAALSSVAEDGVATTQALAEDFPDAARASLAIARRVEPIEGNPVTAFLRRQTGARSLEPRDGDDADAVLSRAEAAVRAGDLDTALSELSALPAEASAPLADWIGRAETRVAAQAAMQAYLETE